MFPWPCYFCVNHTNLKVLLISTVHSMWIEFATLIAVKVLAQFKTNCLTVFRSVFLHLIKYTVIKIHHFRMSTPTLPIWTLLTPLVYTSNVICTIITIGKSPGNIGKRNNDYFKHKISNSTDITYCMPICRLAVCILD